MICPKCRTNVGSGRVTKKSTTKSGTVKSISEKRCPSCGLLVKKAYYDNK